MADEIIKLNIPDVSDAAPDNADAETKEKDGSLIIEFDGTDADFLTIPSVKLADLKLDCSGNITVLTEDGRKGGEDKGKAFEGGDARDGILTPFDRDIFKEKIGTGGRANLLEPLEENIYRYHNQSESATDPDAVDGGSTPVYMPDLTTIVYGTDPDDSESGGSADMPTGIDVTGGDPGGETDPGNSCGPDNYGFDDPSFGEPVDGVDKYGMTEDPITLSPSSEPEYYSFDGVGDSEPIQYSGDAGQTFITGEAPETVLNSAGDDLQREDDLYYLLLSSDRDRTDKNIPDEPSSPPVPDLPLGKGTKISDGDGYEPPEGEPRGRRKPEGAETEPDFKRSDGYVLTKKTDRRTLDRQRRTDIRCEVSKAEAKLYRAELSLLETELSFCKKYASAADKALLRGRRAELKAKQKELKLARKSAQAKNERYFKPVIKASSIASVSLSPEATLLLIDRLQGLLIRRDEINERLCELYTRTQKKKRGSLKGRTEYVKKHLKRAHKSQIRLAKAIYKNSVPKTDSVRLYELMDKYVRLSGRIKGIEYSLGKERVFGPSARELRREHKALLGELKSLSKEINRVEIETIRRARDNNRKKRSMLIGWSIVVLLAALAVAVYVFREPLWELIRGWINQLFDILGWTHFGRL